MTTDDGDAEEVVRSRWRRVFTGDQRQLGALRRWLESVLPDSPERYDVACVATELATNAVRHTASGQGGVFVVEISCYSCAVRVSVTDGGATGEPRMIDDPAGEHGRGLQVVRGLSVRTGVCGDQHGRLVWADVPWDMRLYPATGIEPVGPAVSGRATGRSREHRCLSVGAPEKHPC